MHKRVLCLLGAGGVRAPLFLQAACRRGFRGEVRLYDRDPDRQELMRQMGLLLLAGEGERADEITVRGTGSLEEALSGADAVVVAIRPGGLPRRAADEKAAFSLGVIGQETVGVCGFAMACRTLPALLEIARAAARLGNNPWIFNFTNPVGITSLGLRLAGFSRTVGICDSANGALYAACRHLQLEPDQIQPESFGLNHLSWTRALWHRGRNLLPELLRDETFRLRHQDLFLDPGSRATGLFFNEYLHYYLRPGLALRQMAASPMPRGEWLAAQELTLRGELQVLLRAGNRQGALDLFVRYHAQRSETYMAYAREGTRGAPPAGEAAGAEGYAGVALDILEAAEAGRERVRVLVLPQAGPVGGMPAGVSLEVSCRIQGGSLTPVLNEPVPADCLRLIEQVGLCERLVVESILDPSRDKLRQALERHPLIGPEKAGACLQTLDWNA